MKGEISTRGLWWVVLSSTPLTVLTLEYMTAVSQHRERNNAFDKKKRKKKTKQNGRCYATRVDMHAHTLEHGLTTKSI